MGTELEQVLGYLEKNAEDFALGERFRQYLDTSIEIFEEPE
jgi:hypothetical protein